MTKNKSTEVAVLNEARVAALRKASGVDEAAGNRWPVKVTVNRKPLAEDGSTLPMGKYVVTVNEVAHYLDEIDMVVMEKGTQFMRFTPKGKAQEYIGCTMIENDFNPDYKDSLGGERLGRVSGTAFDDMTDAQKEVKFYFHMIGTADLSSAKDGKGEALYTNGETIIVPVSLQFKGKNSVDKQNEFKKLKKKGEAYFDFVTRLTKPFKAGDIAGIPYYGYHLERGDDVVLTADLLDSIEAAKELIQTENKRIYGLHLAAQAVDNSSESEEGSYTDLDLPDDETESHLDSI